MRATADDLPRRLPEYCLVTTTFPLSGKEITMNRKLQAAALIVAGAGVATMFFTGVPGFPKVPPGPFILIGSGLLVGLLRWRWAPVIGLLAALFIAVGFVAAGGAQISTVAQGAGLTVMLTGVAAALAAGWLALRNAIRS